ncbi:hypothetical protein PAECIP111893_02388 [Paenibacillus plantiphilus]|uniref:Coil containing protein n=1 Tax=Paenibacillus plantiphilus TaxID=2905650 RepID=A0ABM9C833_9BACL|nr:hypothetical protein [Paenibacillus plantiphilus]CAH1205660.1 hypothetical protein PAECIP111893_02388 [Paenibacillus plantiphilus]
MSDQASHSPETQEIQMDAETESIYESFGINPTEKKEIEMPTIPEPTDPAIGQVEEDKPKTALKAKYNGEEIDVPEDQVKELVEKGMNLDKVRSQKTEYEKSLDRVAKLQGYKDHADLIANLDQLEAQQQKQKEQAFDEMQENMLYQLELNGISREDAVAWLEQHPTFQEAKALKESQQQSQQQQQVTSKWQALYDRYPHLLDDAQAFNRGEMPSFFNDEMRSRVDRGYDPLDAFELAHGTEMKQEMQNKTKKQAEQSVIKQMQLGTRGFTEQGAAEPDESDLLPAQVALAESFGVKPENVRKQQKLINNRR